MFLGLAFIIIGVGMLLQKLGFLPYSLDLFWPIIFIAVGLSIICKGKGSDCCDWLRKKEEKKE
jgi:hypothetical protein